MKRNLYPIVEDALKLREKAKTLKTWRRRRDAYHRLMATLKVMDVAAFEQFEAEIEKEKA